MGVTVYLSFLLFDSLVFPSLFLKLHKQDTNIKGLCLWGSFPRLLLIIVWWVLLGLLLLHWMAFCLKDLG